MNIRDSQPTDLPAINAIECAAFGAQKGQEIAQLVHDLFDDATAKPLLSLIAVQDHQPVGHILFTQAKITPVHQHVSIRILAPLAVHPQAQSQGIGGQLIKAGLERLAASGVDLVFVLGHPGYYPRYGFKTAGILGFEAPYPIPDEHADAWMVQQLRDGIIGTVKGKVHCSEVLNQPQHWRE